MGLELPFLFLFLGQMDAQTQRSTKLGVWTSTESITNNKAKAGGR